MASCLSRPNWAAQSTKRWLFRVWATLPPYCTMIPLPSTQHAGHSQKSLTYRKIYPLCPAHFLHVRQHLSHASFPELCLVRGHLVHALARQRGVEIERVPLHLESCITVFCFEFGHRLLQAALANVAPAECECVWPENSSRAHKNFWILPSPPSTVNIPRADIVAYNINLKSLHACDSRSNVWEH